jgi:two-component system response regulator AtoC
MTHVLVVDDDPDFAAGLAEVIGSEGLSVSTAGSLGEARARMAARPPDMLLVDLKLPDGSGIELVNDTSVTPSASEVVLITGHATVETAVDALRQGASDFLTKPVDLARLKMLLASFSRTRDLKEEVGALRRELRSLGRFGPLVGRAPAMQKLYDLVAKVAPSDLTVFLLGETGTGKELVAETIHDLSRRRRRGFFPLNCGAVSPTLMESELFGHERGSFTGAERAHRGIFERANGGTLFLDEITEMSVELQVKLLRVLETAEVLRVGGSKPAPVDVRVIAASNRDPGAALAAGKLREDLLYRLNVFPIHIPPLRERPEDVEALALHFLDLLNQEEGSSKRFAAGAVECLLRHHWPGNVRELKNVVQRAYILSPDGEIGFDGFPLGGGDELGLDLPLRVGTSIAEAERQLILATLKGLGGDKRKAAEVLNISLKTLYNRLNVYKAG